MSKMRPGMLHTGSEQRGRWRRFLVFAFALPLVLMAETTCPAIAWGADYDTAFVRAKKVIEGELAQRLCVALEQRSIEDSDFPFHSCCAPVAFFDRDREVVVVDPERCASFFARARTIREKQDVAFALMLHELVHAYQHAQMKQASSVKLSGRWQRFVCEGHAIEFSQRLAVAAGVRKTVLEDRSEAPSARFSNDFMENRDRLLHQFLYEISRKYVRANCRRLQDFHRLLQKPLSYAEILGKNHPPAASTEACAKIERLKASNREVKEPKEMDYLDAMALVCPERFAQADLASAYRGGALTEIATDEKDVIEVGVLHLDGQDAAAKLRQAGWERCARGIRLAERPAWLPAGDKVWLVREYPRPGRLFLMKQKREFLLLVEFSATNCNRDIVKQILTTLP